ncbi:PREDICTED: 30S ribosomal protein S31, chloroplastic-like [Nicotiana attenuata]|uniref:30s ribosomal protein s31, chloroplastic n=1 Tax=Nicotiana attenuata TaxID=49451 RepID=A0A1J6IEF3_NICAT|nr:PREDICTED: 30S ribosomal protein S31, chloroplastic-like [Nicotiana attenuata]OIT02986.1 30s ribosomal protein s31, chloroplastic [Nicotiana attenuata]
MASSLLGSVPISVQSMAALSPNLSFSRSVSISGVAVSATSSASVSSNVTFAKLPLIYCGRGDKKTAKGKRFNHSFGNARPRNKKKGRGPPRVAAPPAAPKRDPFDDGQVVKIEIVES